VTAKTRGIVNKKRVYDGIGKIPEDKGLLFIEWQINAELKSMDKEENAAVYSEIRTCRSQSMEPTYKVIPMSSGDRFDRANAKGSERDAELNEFRAVTI
jgi:hypothetical protein